jgi:putative transposase
MSGCAVVCNGKRCDRSKRPYRVTTDSNHRQPVASNVLARQFDGWAINRAWVCDITYLPTGEGWLYLAAVMDLASRRIVGWSMSPRPHADLVCQALKTAYVRRKPPLGVILHSDRGSQSASAAPPAAQRLQDAAIDEPQGHCWDNAPMESFFKTLKIERVYQLRYETRAQARLDIVDWIDGFYNYRRLHSSIGYRTPVHMESGRMAA